MQCPRYISGAVLVLINALIFLVIAATFGNFNIVGGDSSADRADTGNETANARSAGESISKEASDRGEKIQERAPEAGSFEQSQKPAARMTAKYRQPIVAFPWRAVSSSRWNHDGSILRLEAIGRARRFFYVELPSGSPAKPGDVAFEGVREGPIFSGRAFLFSENCAPIAYNVKGSASPDETTIVMRGRKPRRDLQCNVTSYEDGQLVFRI